MLHYIVKMPASKRPYNFTMPGPTKHRNGRCYCDPKPKVRAAVKAARKANVQRQIRGH